MIDVAEEVKELYRTDYMPYRNKTVKKELKLYFPELNVTISNENIYTESMKLEESLCPESEIVLGGCEATKFEIAAAGVTEELVGKQMIVTQRIEDTYDMPFGTYIVDSVVKKDGLIFKDITAYDYMLKADVDVSQWYNSLTFPIKIKEFRLSLYERLRYAYVEQNLQNDAVVIQKTINPSYLKGRDVLKAIGEFNGMFGHFTRGDKFKYIGLSSIGLYPSETLYPEEDLFPSEPMEYIPGAGYKSVQFEDYIVEAIDSLQIRQEEGDVGVVVGSSTNNPYIIQGNFLCYGMDAATLKTVADNIFRNIKNKYYRPHMTTLKGLPYLEVGDSVAVISGEDVVESFIFSRTLSGIQALSDEYRATGNKERKNEVSQSIEIEQLRGKAMVITKSVDAVRVEMADIENKTNTKFEQTVESITAEATRASGAEARIELKADGIQTNVSNLANQTNTKFEQTVESITAEATRASGAEGELYSQLSITAQQIAMKVTKGEVSSQISVESGQITLESNRLVVDSTNFKLDANGNATFSGNVDGANVTANKYLRIVDIENNSTSIALEGNVNTLLIGRGYPYISFLNEVTIENLTVDALKLNGGGSFLSSITQSGSGNTVTGLYANGTQIVAVTDIRCTFSGMSSSSTPNARVSGGGNVAQCASSSMRYKKDIKSIENTDLDVRNLYNINVKQFKYRDGYLDKDDQRYGRDVPGFIVEQIERYYPIAVDYKDGMAEMWNSNIIIPAMFGLIKDLHERVSELEKSKNELEELEILLKEKGVI